MTFFDEKYIELLKEKEKTGKLSKLARPAFRLATYPQWQPLRDSINEIFKDLPVHSQGRLRKKRNDFENISQTVNEIKVGFYLINEGYKIEPEKKINNLTPDWFVTTKDNKNFIVEVFTKTISDKDKIETEYFTDLRTLSKKIPIGAWLCIKPRTKNKNIVWSDDLIIKTVSELKDWLKSTPPLRSEKVIEELEFELWAYSEKISYVCFAETNEAFVVNSRPVKNNVESKVEKYRDICNNNKLPLVVVCLPSFETAIGKEEFEEIYDEIFDNHPNLSNIWAFVGDEVEVFHNPKALFSI